MARVRFPDDAVSRPLWRSWQRVGLIIPRSGVRNPPEAYLLLLWRSWQRFGLMSRWPRVRAPAGAFCFARTAAQVTADRVDLFRSFSASCGWMAEWSKALVLGTSLFGGVGSNPTPVIFAERSIHWTWGISSIGRVRRSQRRGTGIETRILHFCTPGCRRLVRRAAAASDVLCCAPIV